MQVQGRVLGAAGLRLGYAETSKENPVDRFLTAERNESGNRKPSALSAGTRERRLRRWWQVAIARLSFSCSLFYSRQPGGRGGPEYVSFQAQVLQPRICESSHVRRRLVQRRERGGETYVQANARNVQERWSCYSFRVSGARRMDEAIHFWQRTGRHKPMGIATRQRLRRCVLSLRAPSHQNHVAGVENVLLARRCGGSKRELPSWHLSSETLVLVAAAAAGGERWGWWSGKDELGRCNQSTPSPHVQQGGVFVPRGWAGTSASVTRVSNECWWC